MVLLPGRTVHACVGRARPARHAWGRPRQGLVLQAGPALHDELWGMPGSGRAKNAGLGPGCHTLGCMDIYRQLPTLGGDFKRLSIFRVLVGHC